MRPRIRTVKPELFLHEELADLEAESELPLRLCFIGIMLVSDREGRFEWRPRAIKALIFPYDDTPVGRCMEYLFYYGHICRYVSGGRQYGFIPSWEQHQRVNHREAKSTLPAPTAENTDDPDEMQPPAVEGGRVVLMVGDGPPVAEAAAVELVKSPALPPPVIGTIAPPAANLVQERVEHIRGSKSKKAERDDLLEAYTEVVFVYWREMMGKTGRTVLDSKRKKKIRARLLENDGDVAELLCTVDGALKDEFLMGTSERSDGKKYDGIEVVFRDRGQVEKLAPLSKHFGADIHPFMGPR